MMNNDMQGKVVIITGSAQGLGKAFALRLLNAGAKVCQGQCQYLFTYFV